MREAIAQGADVNARGTGGITPLFWAFPYHRVERFKLLLEAGADPNLPLTGRTGIPGFTMPGSTVTADAATTRFPDYFELVVKHGADLSIEHWSSGPLPMAIIAGLCRDKKHRLQVYIENGGDLSVTNYMGNTAADRAAGRGYHGLALFLLKQGIDPLQQDIYGSTLIDHLASPHWRSRAKSGWLSSDGCRMRKQLKAPG